MANMVDPGQTAPLVTVQPGSILLLQAYYPNISGNCPKISYVDLYDKMAYANSADPD